MHELASAHHMAGVLAEYASEARVFASRADSGMTGFVEIGHRFREIASLIDECSRQMESSSL